MKSFFKANIFFLLPYFIFLVAGATLILFTRKDDLHLYINGFHTNYANTFFYYLTVLGDGWSVLVIAIVLFFVRRRYSLCIFFSYTLSSIITQTLKHFVFNNYDRPAKFFENNSNLYLVPGVDNNIFYSFPSGHSTTAFSVFFCLALFTSNNWLKLGLFMLALLVGYSRIYLSQHFFEDIYAGSIVGVCSTYLIYSFLFKDKQNSKLEKSLLG